MFDELPLSTGTCGFAVHHGGGTVEWRADCGIRLANLAVQDLPLFLHESTGQVVVSLASRDRFPFGPCGSVTHRLGPQGGANPDFELAVETKEETPNVILLMLL